MSELACFLIGLVLGALGATVRYQLDRQREDERLRYRQKEKSDG